MKRIESFGQWLEEIQENPKLLLFVETDHCSVCHGLLPQVEVLQEDYQIPFISSMLHKFLKWLDNYLYSQHQSFYCISMNRNMPVSLVLSKWMN